MHKTAFIIFLATLASCSSNPYKTDKNGYVVAPEPKYFTKPLVIDNGEEEGWGADIRLSIVNVEVNDTVTLYKAVSSYEGKELGLLLSIRNTKESVKGFSKGITLKSLGIESDHLIQTLSKLYKQKADTSLQFISTISMDYINLREFAKNLGDIEKSTYTMAAEYKLFFEGKNEDEYAELYLNINPTEQWIEIREKDEEYRPALIRFLSK